MGRETVRIEILFSVYDSQREEDEAVVEDFRAAVGALLALPRYVDVVALDEGCTEAYRALPGDDDRMARVRADLSAADWAVRKAGHR